MKKYYLIKGVYPKSNFEDIGIFAKRKTLLTAILCAYHLMSIGYTKIEISKKAMDGDS